MRRCHVLPPFDYFKLHALLDRPPEKDAYLLMRNLILALWHDDCSVSVK